MTRILSGIQPTGEIHLGNYLGALRHWVAEQADAECLDLLADLHAITVPSAEQKFSGKRYAQLKTALTNALLEFLQPIQDHYSRARSPATNPRSAWQRCG